MMKHISLHGANLRCSRDISQFLMQFHSFCSKRQLIEHMSDDGLGPLNLGLSIGLKLQTDKTGDPLTLPSASPEIYSTVDYSDKQESFVAFCHDRIREVVAKRGKSVVATPWLDLKIENALNSAIRLDPDIGKDRAFVIDAHEISGCQYPSVILVMGHNSFDFSVMLGGIYAVMSRATLYLTVIFNNSQKTTPFSDVDAKWKELLRFFLAHEKPKHIA